MTAIMANNPKNGNVADGVKVKVLDFGEEKGLGEICVRTPTMIESYLDSREDDSFVIIDGEKFYRTGDIGRILDDGTFQIVDRLKSSFKLSQGEFVTPERLEKLFEESDLIECAFV